MVVCPKDPFLPKHPQLEVPNIQVRKLMQSLASRELVHERFNWQHFYYILTDKVLHIRSLICCMNELVEPLFAWMVSKSSESSMIHSDIIHLAIDLH